jgi:hypothetical protein
MKTYEEWCKRYDYYDPASQEAKDDYARYREQLEFFQSIPKEDSVKCRKSCGAARSEARTRSRLEGEANT